MEGWEEEGRVWAEVRRELELELELERELELEQERERGGLGWV